MSEKDAMLPDVGKLVEIKNIAPEIKIFSVKLSDGANNGRTNYLPGQFAFISAFGTGEAPFGIASVVDEEGVLQFAVQRLGGVTTALHELGEGDVVGVRGPLGNHFPMEKYEGKKILVLGGGIGAAPLRPVIQYIQQNRPDFAELTILMAARTPEHHLFLDDYPEWESMPDTSLHLTVDEGDETWEGEVGLITNLLKNVNPDPHNTIAIMCGPPVMIFYTNKVLADLGFPASERYVTLEARMHCGIGKCGRCNLGEKLVCVDGPVFTMEEVGQLLESYL